MDEFEKFYNKALKFLSYRPRSVDEVRKNLLESRGRFGSAKRNTTPEIAEKIIEKLKEYKFLDDKEFVKWWIEQRTNYKPRSLRLIKMELGQKGIGKDLIEEVIESLENKVDDLQSAKKLIEKRARKYKNLPREEKFQKVARFLASKGFNYDIIKEVFKEFS
ncbi:MAG: regulatory protein RecX [Patescibacteria group bacterium]